MSAPHKGSFKERALHGLKVYWIVAIYLYLFLGTFTVYRRLVVAEVGSAYLHYGIALVQALVIAKIVLIGEMFSFSRAHDDKPLIVPVIYKAILFGVLVVAFGVVERLIGGWIHHQGLMGGIEEITSMGRDEFLARVLLLIVAFIPFFAFGEIGRVVGMDRLTAIFFSKEAVRDEMTRRAS